MLEADEVVAAGPRVLAQGLDDDLPLGLLAALGAARLERRHAGEADGRALLVGVLQRPQEGGLQALADEVEDVGRRPYMRQWLSMVSNSSEISPGVSLGPRNIVPEFLRPKWNSDRTFFCTSGWK